MKDFFQYQYNDLLVFQTPNLWNTYQSYNYIVTQQKKAVVFDPGELAPIANTIEKNNLELQAIFLTHHHPDHVGAVAALLQKFPCEVYGFSGDLNRFPEVSHPFDAGDRLKVFDKEVRVIHLPGHTLGLCAFHFIKEQLLFSNDHIFSLGCGRVFEGTYDQMYDSLQRVCELPDSTTLFPSHEYTQTNLEFSLAQFPTDPKLLSIKDEIIEKRKQNKPTVPTTLGFEKKYNLFLRTHDPKLAEQLQMPQSTPTQIFKELRKRKDNH